MNNKRNLTHWPTDYGFLFPITNDQGLTGIVDVLYTRFLDLDTEDIQMTPVSNLPGGLQHQLLNILCSLALEELFLSDNPSPLSEEISLAVQEDSNILRNDLTKITAVLRRPLLEKPHYRLIRLLRQGRICGFVDALTQQLYHWSGTPAWAAVPQAIASAYNNHLKRAKAEKLDMLLRDLPMVEKEKIPDFKARNSRAFQDAIHGLLDGKANDLTGELTDLSLKENLRLPVRSPPSPVTPSQPVRITKEICLDIIFASADQHATIFGDASIEMQLRYECVLGQSDEPSIQEANFVIQGSQGERIADQEVVGMADMLKTYEILWELVLSAAQKNPTLSQEKALIRTTKNLEVGCRSWDGGLGGIVAYKKRSYYLNDYWLHEFVYRLSRTFAYLKVATAKTPQAWIESTGHTPSVRDDCLRF